MCNVPAMLGAYAVTENKYPAGPPPERFGSIAEKVRYETATPEETKALDEDYARRYAEWSTRHNTAMAQRHLTPEQQQAPRESAGFLERKADGSVALFDPKWIGLGGGSSKREPSFPKPGSDAIKALKRGEGTNEQFDEVFGPGAAAKALRK